jgi:hypothetical protein
VLLHQPTNQVFWGDHRLAALWANSDAAKAEFPDYNFLVRFFLKQGPLDSGVGN